MYCIFTNKINTLKYKKRKLKNHRVRSSKQKEDFIKPICERQAYGLNKISLHKDGIFNDLKLRRKVTDTFTVFVSRIMDFSLRFVKFRRICPCPFYECV